MPDILPDMAIQWQQFEKIWLNLIQRYGYQECRFPTMEETALFKRSIGDVTDIVEKEMFTFEEKGKGGKSISLRPEGTASCVRLCLEHGLLHNQQQRLWYMGPMYRHENPQKGRYRQFHQIGVEAFGYPGPDIDVELILLTKRLWEALGIKETVRLEINSLGSSEARQAYRLKLVEYFNQHLEVLDEDSKNRLEKNPLRILDSKNPAMQSVIADAPSLLESIDEESKNHFEAFKQALTDNGVEFVVNPRLVRGLDYYNRTVFEWVTEELGAQGAICAGGRYDGLVDMLGGKSTPSVGFAMGIERILLLQQLKGMTAEYDVDGYLVTVGEKAHIEGICLAEQIRSNCPNFKLIMHANSGSDSFKSQFKKADKSGAKLALILGETEVEAKAVGLKFLREDKAQVTKTWHELPAFLNEWQQNQEEN